MSRMMLRPLARLLSSTALAVAMFAVADAPAKAQGYEQYDGMGGGVGRRGGWDDQDDDRRNGPGDWDDKKNGPGAPNSDFSKSKDKDRSNDGPKGLSRDDGRRGPAI